MTTTISIARVSLEDKKIDLELVAGSSRAKRRAAKSSLNQKVAGNAPARNKREQAKADKSGGKKKHAKKTAKKATGAGKKKSANAKAKKAGGKKVAVKKAAKKSTGAKATVRKRKRK